MDVRGYQPPVKSNRKRIILIVSVVLVVGILAFLWLNRTTGTIEDRTASWASYKNAGFGLSLKYPNEFQLTSTGSTLASISEEGNEEVVMAIKVHADPALLPLDQWVSQHFGDNQPQDIQPATVGGMEGLVMNRTVDDVTSRHYFLSTKSRVFEISTDPDLSQTDEDILANIAIEPAPDPQPQATSTVELDGMAYKVLFDTIALPGTQKVREKPAITGDAAADAHIQEKAEARGYRLRATPTVDLSSADGYPLQTEAASAWEAMQTAAASEGISLRVTSGYRSVDEQRVIFLSRLTAACGAAIGHACSNEEIANGAGDAAIEEVLKTSSIPGYSRHHTGFTVDIGDPAGAFEDFAGTPGHSWMSANNYANAKKFGFIPSYPDGAGQQGPDPEPWEYVWVGTGFLQANE